MKQNLSVPAFGAQPRHMILRHQLHLAAFALVILATRCTSDPETEAHSQSSAAGSNRGASGQAASATADASAAGQAMTAAHDAAAEASSAAGAQAGGVAGAAGALDGAPPPDDGLPTWSGIFLHELHSCRRSICHGKGIAGVDMTTQQAAYDSLVDQPADPSRECAMLGLKRVAPGDPDNSLLYLKIDINAPCGQQMPPGGVLTTKTVTRIRDWIAMGAKND